MANTSQSNKTLLGKRILVCGKEGGGKSTVVALIAAILRFIEDQGSEVSEARRLRLSLEEVFLQVIGIKLDAMKKEKKKSGVRIVK